MLKISAVVEDIVYENPLLFDAIGEDIVNFRQVAKNILLQVEARTLKTVSVETITVSLSRLAGKIQKKKNWLKIVAAGLQDFSTKTPITQFVCTKSETNLQALSTIKTVNEEFFSITVGKKEINILASPYYRGQIVRTLHVLHELPAMTLLTIHFSEKLVTIPGLIYFISSLMYRGNIPIIEIVSTYTELNLLVETKNLQKATQIITKQMRFE